MFKLAVTKEKSILALFEDNTEVASREWLETRDVGRQLFRAIDELLAERRMKPEDVVSFEIDSDMPESYTSMRIAETVKRVYTFCVKQKTDKQR